MSETQRKIAQLLKSATESIKSAERILSVPAAEIDYHEVRSAAAQATQAATTLNQLCGYMDAVINLKDKG